MRLLVQGTTDLRAQFVPIVQFGGLLDRVQNVGDLRMIVGRLLQLVGVLPLGLLLLLLDVQFVNVAERCFGVRITDAVAGWRVHATVGEPMLLLGLSVAMVLVRQFGQIVLDDVVRLDCS